MSWLRLSHMRSVVELLNMVLMGFSCSVVVLLTRMNEPLVADKQVAACEGFGADLADEGLLLGVSANVSLKVLLYCSCSVSQWPRQIISFPCDPTRRAKRRWQCGQGRVLDLLPDCFLLTLPEAVADNVESMAVKLEMAMLGQRPQV
jgi:hypothetical protein